MKEEFNLSDKLELHEEDGLWYVEERIIKEFIKRLKKEIANSDKVIFQYDEKNPHKMGLDLIDIFEVINKLAGDKLK